MLSELNKDGQVNLPFCVVCEYAYLWFTRLLTYRKEEGVSRALQVLSEGGNGEREGLVDQLASLVLNCISQVKAMCRRISLSPYCVSQM